MILIEGLIMLLPPTVMNITAEENRIIASMDQNGNH